MYDYYSYYDMVREQQITNQYLSSGEIHYSEIKEDIKTIKNSQGSLIILLGTLIVFLLARNLKRNGR